jgi:predicted CXXCH cytochrome family protein
MINETDQRRRRAMAERFLADYPASWRLGPVYEVASKSSYALGDFPAALEFGAKSIRLLPENPFLLLVIADAQTRTGLYDSASRSAREALGYLERFDRPTSIEERAWPQLKQRYLAECYFDIGRAAASQGLASAGDAGARFLADAERALVKSVSFNAGGAGAAYLLGMVYLADGRPLDAARAFAAAAREQTGVGPQALGQLRALHSDAAISGGKPFDDWLAALKAPLPEPAEAMRHNTAPKRSQYAGSETCRQCHASQHAAWQSTGMAKMFRPYRPDDVIGDFTSGESVADESGRPAARPVLNGGRHFLEIREGERWTRYPVEYLIGSKWQQAYATTMPGGEIEVFPLQYNRLEKRWVNYWKIIDPAGSRRTDITRFSQIDPGATYQFECAPCHTSQQKFAGGVIRAKAGSFREGGINCEMCHGPSASHAAAMRTGAPYEKDPAEPPVDFKRISAPEYVAVCSQCHMQSGERDPEPAGAMNYSESGEKFYRTLSSRPFVDYSRKAFYKDGRFRETVFIVESFTRSACFRSGGATCGNCHDPHPADVAKNPASLKFGADSDRMCLGCHAPLQAGIEAHTHHPAASEASRCVACHMPRIMNSLLFKARYHQIDDIPDAEMTTRFGPVESPNACLLCHKDRDAAWLGAKLKAWKGNAGNVAR